MARSHEPWFEYLLRNKAIRSFLTSYAEQDWQEVCKLTLLYGIVNLNTLEGKAIVPLEKLRDIVAHGAAAVTVEDAIPDLNNKLEELKFQLDDVAQDIHKGESVRAKYSQRYSKAGVEAGPPAAELPPRRITDQQRSELAAANVALRQAAKWLRYKGRGLAIDPQDMPVGVLDRAAAAEVAQRAISPFGLPSSEWRSGDRSRTYSPPGKKRSPVLPGDGLQGAEYPSWWGDGEDMSGGGGSGGPASPQRDGGRSRSAPRSRPPPRLAYSVQVEPGAEPLWKNDLVTARYMDVPSSGYGRAASSPPRQPPPQQQQLYMPPPGGFQGYPVAEGPPPQQQGVSVPFQGPYGNGGTGPQLYVVQPTGAVVPAGGPAPTVAVVPAWAQPPPPQPQQQLQQQRSSDEVGRPSWKPIRTAKVTSRIAEQVQADKAAARSRRQARQRAAEAAVAVGGAWPRSRLQPPPQDAPGAWSVAGTSSPRSPGGPSEIADNLASNPFTAWFMAPTQPQQPQLQQPQEVQMQRPSTPAPRQSQPQQPPWGSALQQTGSPRAASARAPAPGGGAGGPAALPSWLVSPQSGPLPLQPQGPAGASLTFYPQVSPVGHHSQSLGGTTYPPAAAGQAAPGSPGSYGVRQYGGGDAGLYQTMRRVAWADSPTAHRAASPGVPAWLNSSPAANTSPWEATPWLLQPPQQQQQQQRQPTLTQEQGRWLGQQPVWSGAPAPATSYGIAGAGWGWGDGAGWQGPGAAGASAPRSPHLSPRAEALQGVRPEVVKWSKSWVGDFGHLGEPRFPPAPVQPIERGGGSAPATGRRSVTNGGATGSGGGEGGEGAVAAAGASRGGAAAPSHKPSDGGPAAGRRHEQLPPELATADALLAAAVAAAREGRGEAGLYGGGDAAVAALRQPPDAQVAERRSTAGLGAAHSGAETNMPAGEGARGAGPSGAISGGGGGDGGRAREGAAAAALETAWGRVMGQVSRLGNVPGVEIGKGWRGGDERDEMGGKVEGAVAAGTGGVKWDFDKILGSPSGLTYQ